MKPEPEEEKIIKYLLSQLPPEEQSEMEDRFVSDREQFELICAVEDDLIEDYLAGALPARVRHQFEQIYRASDVRFKRVTLAADLRETLKLQLPRANQPENEKMETRPRYDSPVALLSFVLFPGIARDADEDPQTVMLADAEPDAIVLELELNAAGEFEMYEAGLKSMQGETIFSKDGLSAVSYGAGSRVRFQLPGGALRAGDYIAALYGRTAGEAELIDHYYFRVSDSEEPGTGSSL